MSGPRVLLLQRYAERHLGDAELIHQVAAADVVRMLWPPPARYLYVLLTLAPAHRLIVWQAEPEAPGCPSRLADMVLTGQEDDFDWPSLYRELTARPKQRRNPPADTFGHPRGRHDIGTVLLLALHGGRDCPLKPVPPDDDGLEGLGEKIRRLDPSLFTGPLGVADWLEACPHEPWLHLWMGLFDHYRGRHARALVHFARVLGQGFRHRFFVWYLLRTAAVCGAHTVTARCVEALAPFPLDLPHMETLTRRLRGSAADTPSYPLLEHVWHARRVYADARRIMRALSGWQGLEEVRFAWVTGSRPAEVYGLLNRLCPQLHHLVLLVPHPEQFKLLQPRFRHDKKVTLLHYALGDRNRTARYIVDGGDQPEAPSPRPMTDADRDEEGTFQVPVRTLEEVAEQHRLALPDLLMLELEGEAGAVLAGMSAAVLSRIAVLSARVGTTPLYQGAKTLDDLKGRLRQSHRFMGLSPERGCDGGRGHALFLSHTALSGRAWPARQAPRGDAVLTPLADGELCGLEQAVRDYFLMDFRATTQVSGVARPVYIWGTGERARRLRPVLCGLDLDFAGFVERDAATWGTTLHGYPVYPPDHLKHCTPRPVVVPAVTNPTEVEARLVAMGYSIARDTVLPGWNLLERG